MAHSWVCSGYRKAIIDRRKSLQTSAGAVLLLLATSVTTPFSTAQAAGSPKQLRVFAAADLVPVMPALAQLYEQKTGVKLKVSTGSSGMMTTQIENGAPADIFLGADFTFPEKLVADNLTDAKAPIAYARGTLVLFARKDSPLQPLDLDRLRDPRAQKIAVADETHAPYGRAAMSALTRMHFIDAVRPRLVIAENVAQTGQFVESGNAQLGLISLTLASSERYRQVGTYVIVPASQYPEIRQCAVVIAKGNTAEAHAFLKWLLSSDIQQKLPNVGLRPAE